MNYQELMNARADYFRKVAEWMDGRRDTHPGGLSSLPRAADVLDPPPPFKPFEGAAFNPCYLTYIDYFG